MSNLNHIQKEKIISSIWRNGTLEAAVQATGIPVEMIQAEMKKSAIFKRRIKKALEEAKGMLIDEARALVRDYMRGKYNKTDRNQLTAAIALLNAYEPGFRGVIAVKGRIQHNIEIISAVPRPLRAKEIKLLDNPSKKRLKSRRVEIYDEKGEYIGTKVELEEAVEEAIEGEGANVD